MKFFKWTSDTGCHCDKKHITYMLCDNTESMHTNTQHCKYKVQQFRLQADSSMQTTVCLRCKF